MEKLIKFQKINGRWAIDTNALCYCNTKYHAPYLARLTDAGEMEWQEKTYLGYGKHRRTYYIIENLRPGDYIQAAGGSGKNKYPAKCQVVDISFDGETPSMVIKYISDQEWGNLVAERKKNAPAPQETPAIAGRKTVRRDGVLMLYDPAAKTTHFLAVLRPEDVPPEERAGFRALLAEEAARLEAMAAAYRALADAVAGVVRAEGGEEAAQQCKDYSEKDYSEIDI
jgi:hypothetical protein